MLLRFAYAYGCYCNHFYLVKIVVFVKFCTNLIQQERVFVLFLELSFMSITVEPAAAAKITTAILFSRNNYNHTLSFKLTNHIFITLHCVLSLFLSVEFYKKVIAFSRMIVVKLVAAAANSRYFVLNFQLFWWCFCVISV